MRFFTLKCLPFLANQLFFLVLNILIIAIGAAHIRFSYQYSLMKNASISLLISTGSSAQLEIMKIKSLCDPPMIFGILVGVIQILISLILVFALFNFFSKAKRIFWFRVFIFLIMVQLIGNFSMAIFTSLMIEYYGVLFDSSISMSEMTYNSIAGETKSYVDSQRVLYKFTLFEAIYTWIISIPAIIMLLVGILSEFIGQQNYRNSSDMTSGLDESTRIQSVQINKSINYLKQKK